MHLEQQYNCTAGYASKLPQHQFWHYRSKMVIIVCRIDELLILEEGVKLGRTCGEVDEGVERQRLKRAPERFRTAQLTWQ